MVNSIVRASRVYIDTLHTLGAIHPKEMYGLAILIFLLDYKTLYVHSREELEELNRIVDCLKRQGCLAKRVTNFNCAE